VKSEVLLQDCDVNYLVVSNTNLSSVMNAASLVGHAAPPEFIQKVTVITINHDSRIKRIDTVRAYTFGSLYFVEV
jgi:hypothetical protein